MDSSRQGVAIKGADMTQRGLGLQARVVTVACGVWLAQLACPSQDKGPAGPGVAESRMRVRPVLKFEPGRSLSYRFVGTREIEILWERNAIGVAPDPNHADPQEDKPAITRMHESLDLVVEYTPRPTDEAHVTTLEAVVKSVRVTRTSSEGGWGHFGPDPVEALQGRTFTLLVEDRGRIKDANALDLLLKEIGRRAFHDDPRHGRIKDPEMIADVIATQWFLWDSIASMDANGVEVGQSWTGRLSVPTPMVMRKARDVTYRLEAVEPAGEVAVILGTYILSPDKAPASWPIPYSGKLRASGTFGFLGMYKATSLTGQGLERFNLRTGRTEGYRQEYHLEIDSAVPFVLTGMPTSAKIRIDQTIVMEQASGSGEDRARGQ